MTVWVVATVALLVLFAGAAVATCRGTTLDRLVGFKLASVVLPLVFVTFAIATRRTMYLDVALVAALLGFAGGLAYVRLLERWL